MVGGGGRLEQYLGMGFVSLESNLIMAADLYSLVVLAVAMEEKIYGKKGTRVGHNV